MALKMEDVVSLCKRRGFVFQSSEIYGGFASCWDYGPLGAELKRNVKNAWWRAVVQERDDMVGLDSSILMHPKIWEASGHVATFNDPLVDCKTCKGRFRQDHLDVTQCPQKPSKLAGQAEQCALTEARLFNLMFKTHVGPVEAEDGSNMAYLRPETAQGIFVNFNNVLNTSRKKLPFGIAQIGKAFRNEITPGNFTFRTREFEQMEIEYFCRPEDAPRIHEEWIAARHQWYLDLGMKAENLSLRPHEKDELAHYAQSAESTGTTDIEYQFPFMEKPAELEGIANRADFDLTQHSKFSGQKLSYFDPQTNEHITPYVIEPSAGADRGTLAFLVDAYHEEEVKPGDMRTVLKFHPDLAPIKVAVLPLLKKRDDIVEVCQNLTRDLKKKTVATYDDTAGIGKLYRRQDEIGTPFCITVDVDTVEKDQSVTVRDRDTMLQERVHLDQVKQYVLDKLAR
ncbi:MAG TPA: glycine--tRNA ligase [Abditibacteriaceae bacterium]|nr:glycine--tRNA ligase [Abditibacteriaceae bacterium]